MEPTKETIAAMEDMVFAYEKSIADLENGERLEGVLERWARFGRTDSCLLCLATDLECEECPMRHDGAQHLNSMYCMEDRLENSFHVLYDAVREDTGKPDFLRALKNRLSDLLAVFSDNGRELK